jgi:ribosome maturation factor RimP
MNIGAIEKAADELLRPVVESMGYELVEIRVLNEQGRWVLRLMADREGGITLDECARLSREVAPHLDVADVIPYRYNLEVSSPGLRRPLNRREDFLRFAGERVMVRTRQGIDGRKRFRGIGRGLDEQQRLIVEPDEGGDAWRIPLDWIEEARLDPEIKI